MDKTTSVTNSNLVKAKFLAELVLLQLKTAPIHLSVGTTIDGTVYDNFICIKDAPGLVVQKVIELAEKYGCMYSLNRNGLFVDFYCVVEMTQQDFFK